MAQSNKIKIVLEYDHKDSCKLLKYKIFFKKHIDNGDKIPSRVLKDFVSIFTIEEERIEKEIKELINRIKNDGYLRYSVKYNFKKKITYKIDFWDDIPDLNNKLTSDCVKELTLKDLLDYIFLDSLLTRNNKKELIENVYSRISEYFKECNKSEKILSRYARGSITGFIVHRLGYPVTKGAINEEDISNDDFFQGVKNYIPSHKAPKNKQKRH